MKIISSTIKILMITIMVFLLLSSKITATGVSLDMEFDKTTYQAGDEVEVNLHFSNTGSISTNSLGIELEYDTTYFQLLNHNAETDIVNTYIPYNVKVHSAGSENKDTLYLTYMDMTSYTPLQPNTSATTIRLAVNEDAPSGDASMTIKKVNLLEDLDIFTVNGGVPKTFTVAITGKEQPIDPEPTPADPKPSDPEPTPADPKPGDPTEPVEPKPSQPSPGQPSSPSQPSPAQPAPSPIIPVQDEEMVPNIEKDESIAIVTTFQDTLEHWARTDIESLLSLGIIKGRTETLFEPEQNITRAEFATLIIRAMNLELLQYRNTYTDVHSNAWYADVVYTATNYGLIGGYEGKFRPVDFITREEIARITVEAYKAVSEKPITAGNISIYEDNTKISPWATEYIKDAVGLGLIQGMSGTIIAPTDQATRAQAAVITKRFLEATR